jgi:hypothetical protein
MVGWAEYGDAGDEAAQIPVNVHDLDECKRIVNKAIRMFISQAPPAGWRWAQPVASLALWPTIAENVAVTVTGGAFSGGVTTITASADSFYPSMEEKTISIDGVGDFTIQTYTSPAVIVVTGDASTASADLWSISSNGNYTLPRTFSGQYAGEITYAAGTDQGTSIAWSTDALIRQWRENVDSENGDPFLAAVRVMDTGTPRRRWELMAYPNPDEVITVEFPFDLHFDSLVDLTEVPPTPFAHDESIRAACRALAETDIQDGKTSTEQNYYQNICLPNSWKIDARSAPRRLGNFGGPQMMDRAAAFKQWRDNWYQRPDVTINL